MLINSDAATGLAMDGADGVFALEPALLSFVYDRTMSSKNRWWLEKAWRRRAERIYIRTR